MKPLTVILAFALLAFVALSLYLVQDFMGPLAIAAVAFVLIMIFLRR
jgi:hypothetical protein